MSTIWFALLLPLIHIYSQIHNCNNANIPYQLLSCSGSNLQIRADYYMFVFLASVQAEYHWSICFRHTADESKLLQA
jgi:hypothetical protein